MKNRFLVFLCLFFAQNWIRPPSCDLQVKYRKDFEESKGRGLRFLIDTPEVQRLKKAQDQISNVRPEWYSSLTITQTFTGLTSLMKIRKRSQKINNLVCVPYTAFKGFIQTPIYTLFIPLG